MINTNYPAQIIDPTTKLPFQEAQLLWPCGDSVSKRIALEFFGEMTSDGVCAKAANCPRCQKHTTAYKPNPDLQNLVNFVLQGTSKPTESAPAPATVPVLFPPYPIKPTTFKITADNIYVFKFEAAVRGKFPIYLITINIHQTKGSFWFDDHVSRAVFLKKVALNLPQEKISFTPEGDFYCYDKNIFKEFILYIVRHNSFTSDVQTALQLLDE